MLQMNESKLFLPAVLTGLALTIWFFGTIVTILGIAILIALHEAGHWIVARLSGISVPVFSVGFGRAEQAFVIGKFWGTEFQLRPIPLGGFIKPDDQSYGRASLFARAATMLAGPLMNLIVPIPLFFALYATTGVPHVAAIKDVYVSQLADTNPIAKSAGVKSGDILVSIEGAKIASPDDISAALFARKSLPTRLGIMRTGEEKTVVLTPDAEGKIGVMLAIHADFTRKEVGIGEAFFEALGKTTDMTWQTVKMYGSLFRGEHLGEVSGIVGIVAEGNNHMHTGVGDAVFFLSMISIVLGVANFLPIPGLDGGHLAFLAIEKLRGKPLSPSVQADAVKFAIVFFALVFVLSLYNDLVRLVGDPWATPLMVLIVCLSVSCFWPRSQDK